MKQFRLDVLSLAPVRRLVARAGFPVVFQGLALLGMLGLAWVGWGVGPGVPARDLLTLRKTNLATLAVWGLWWPSMIGLALALGRAWCTVCPAELANRAADALARSAGWPRARLGRWARAGWAMVVAYLVLQLAVVGLSIHRVPHATSLMLLGLLGAAVLAGLLFRDPRSFCRGLCPVNPLLSVYGRFTPVQLDVVDRDACAACTTKDCVALARRFRLDGRSCPSRLRPHAREAGDGCVLCLQCAKACPHGNVGLGWARPGAAVRQRRSLRPFEAAFVIIAAGLVTHELAGEVPWLEEAFHAMPRVLGAAFGLPSFAWAEAAWFLGVFPVVLWSLVAALSFVVGHRGSVREALLAGATGAAPVVAVAHLAKALAKGGAWAAYLPLAMSDPSGLGTLADLAAGRVSAPARWVPLDLVGWLVMLLMAGVAWRSWRWIREAAPSVLAAGRVGFVTTALWFTAVLAAWTRT